jgi:type III restriction enzyme
LEVNEEAVQGKLLLVPVYQFSQAPLYQSKTLAKFQLDPDNLELLHRYFEYIDDDRVLLALYEAHQPEQIAALRTGLNKAKDMFRTDGRPYKNLDVLTRQALTFFSIHGKELSSFKELSDEINHFKHIKVALEEIGDLERRIRRVLDYGNAVREAKAHFAAHQITLDEYTAEIGGYSQSETFFANHFQLDIRRIANHYYIPILLSPNEKIDFIRSVIHVESEVQFMGQLEAYLRHEANQFKQFDWWLFSRVDEKSDNITLPYYYPFENKIYNFKPDFIFWLKKGKRYHIVFIDPKGTGRTEYEHKVDGYRALFEENGLPRLFTYQGLQVSVHVFLYTPDRQYLAGGYQRYWFDRVEQVMESLRP